MLKAPAAPVVTAARIARATSAECPTLVGEGIRGLLGDSLERGPGELPRTRVQC